MSDHWQQVSLAEICSVSAGNSAPQDPAYFTAGTIPFFRTSDAGRVKFGTIYESQDKLNEQGASKLRRYPAGTILFPKSGASTFLNHRVVLGVEGCVSSHLATIVPNLSHVLPQFLLYALTLIDAKDLIQDQSYPSLNLPAIEKISIHLPPIAEQQRIVRLLDDAFKGIAIAKANAEKNLQNARALFENHLQSVFTQGGDEWETKSIGEICTFKRGLTYAKTDEADDSENVVLRAMNIDLATNRLDFSELKYIDNQVVVPDEKKVKSGSLMICMASGSKSHLGKVAFIEEDYGHAFGGFMGMLTPSTSVLPRYLFHVMTSGLYKNFIGSMSAGANINNLTFEKLSAFTFPIPPLTEQQHIVAMLDKIETCTSQLSAAYLAKSRAVESLGVSLLHHAFSGKLEAA
jgi:type I restriction enzyme S subunit